MAVLQPCNTPDLADRGASITPEVLQWSTTRPGSVRHLVTKIFPSPRDSTVGVSPPTMRCAQSHPRDER
jgi:hypothetical protein